MHFSSVPLFPAQNTTLKYMKAGKIVYEFFMTAYFQMLGNFGLDILAGEGNLDSVGYFSFDCSP